MSYTNGYNLQRFRIPQKHGIGILNLILGHPKKASHVSTVAAKGTREGYYFRQNE
jgi:hypothetical protein